MKRLFAVTMMAICILGFFNIPAFAGGDSVMTRITVNQLSDILSEAGYSPEIQKETAIRVRMGEVTVLFFIADNRQNIQAYAGFKGGDSSVSNMNEWNKNKRYSRAYKDDDGDAVIELDLDFEGGISRNRVANFIQTVALSAKVFREHIYGK